MIRNRTYLLTLSLFILTQVTCAAEKSKEGHFRQAPDAIKLSDPSVTGIMTLEETLSKRRSVRNFANVPVTLGEISQLLWSAQGITSERGYRTAPSAGASYPLEIYLLIGKADSLAPGLYRYLPGSHQLTLVLKGDIRESIAAAALGQKCVRTAPAIIVIAAVYDRVKARYGERGIRYTDMEAGHVGQNISLQAVALGLGTVMVGAFDDRAMKDVLKLGKDEVPLYLIPVGHAETEKAR